MTRTRSQAGKLSRRKGAAFERQVVKLLQEAGIGCRRNTGQAGSARVQGCDIEDTNWWIECGHGKAMDPRLKWLQAEEDCARCEDFRPIAVIWRRDHGPIQVTVAFGDLLHVDRTLCGDIERTMLTMSFADWIRWAR